MQKQLTLLFLSCIFIFPAARAYGQGWLKKILKRPATPAAASVKPPIPPAQTVAARRALSAAALPKEVLRPPFEKHLPAAPKVSPSAAALQRQIKISAEEARIRKQMEEFNETAEWSVLALQSAALGFMLEDNWAAGTAFVIEEEYQGKKYLWGVTAAHVAEALGGTQPAIRIPQINIPLSVHFEIRGTSSMADVALFPIPAEMAQTFQPIKLAQEEPRIGEQLRSFGFFNEGFHLVEHREVKEVTPGRIITSLEFNTPNRAGACGGPVLNTRNEAVGMHCGSSDGKQISFVIPAWQIKDMLRAYRNDGRAARPLIFKGVVIGEINIDEAITQIRVFSDGMEIDSFNTHHKEKDVDYAHLEKPLFLAGADRVEFTIFSQSKKKFFRLVYNLETKQIQLLTP